MSDFSSSELHRLDLTLLLVFLGLLRHRKARDVTAQLGVTQSAISRALKRLRDIFGDALFLRRPHGMGTGTSNSKPAVMATPEPGAALKVTRPVVVSTDPPEACLSPPNAMRTVLATGFAMALDQDCAPEA